MDAQRAEHGAAGPQTNLVGDSGVGQAERLRALAESTGVGAIMSRNVVCLSPQAEVHAVTEMFLDRDFSSAPVVDAGWLPLGVVSKTDLLRHFSGGAPPKTTLSQMAERDAQSAAGGLQDLAASTSRVTSTAPGGAQVADVTAPFVLSLHEEAPISVAAALMAYEGVHRLPIVDTAGQVVGVVSTLDVVRWLAESTGAGPQGS